MNLTEKALFAELKFRVLEATMMLNDGYTKEDVISKLLELVELIENAKP